MESEPARHDRRGLPYTLDYDTPVDARLQKTLEGIDARLRETYGMTTEPSGCLGFLGVPRDCGPAEEFRGTEEPRGT